MPKPRPDFSAPFAPTWWQKWLLEHAGWLRLTPLALLLPVLTALLAAWGLQQPTQGRAQGSSPVRYLAAAPPPLPQLHADDPTSLLGDLPPLLPWSVRLSAPHAVPLPRPATISARPLAFWMLSKCQLEGG